METIVLCPNCRKPLAPGAPLGLCPECLIKSGFDTASESERGGFVPPTVDELAQLFPQLEIVELLGRGGMGVVYRARQPRLDRSVALKILARDKENDAKFTERFEREARALARLNHPNIVAVYDFGEAGGHCYLLMEYVDGLSLRQLLQSGKIKPEEALTIVPRICEALQFAHEHGIVHRDIKPENILLDKVGSVKIADFGIAKIVGRDGKSTLTEAQVVGTPHYMAPEQVEHPQTVDHRADIYSLGVVFYEMLTGELPLGKFAPPSNKVRVDVRLDEVVLHALEKEPDRRYQHASEVKTDVETIAASPRAASTEWDEPHLSRTGIATARSPKPNRWEAALLGIGLAVFVAGLAIAGTRPPPTAYVLGSLCVVGLIICLLTLAGLWPFPSFLVPDSGFSGRNLPGRKRGEAADQKRENPPWQRALIGGLAVFAGVFALLAIVTFVMPRDYEAKAKIIVRDEKLNSVRSDAELDWALRDVAAAFLSPQLQDQIVTELNLRERWAGRFGARDLTETEARQLLAKHLTIERPPRTAIFEIGCFSTQPEEATEIANKAAELFCSSAAWQSVSLIERATPPRLRARPNEPLNLAFAAAVGLVLGIAFGAGVLLVAVVRPREVAAAPRSVQEPLTGAESKSVAAARWTARVVGTLLLMFYGVFVLAEGLPPIGSQPGGVQLNFAALGLMLLGFITGWKREGAAALLIASGWTLWHISEGRIAWNIFQTPLPVAGLYGFCWWATAGRKTRVVLATTASLAVALGLGRLLCPTSVFVRGVITDATSGKPISNAQLTLMSRPASSGDESGGPNARSGADGSFNLYIGWYVAEKRLAIAAPGYATLTTNLGPRGLGERRVSRDFRLQPSDTLAIEFDNALLRDAIQVLANHLRLNVVFDPQLELDRGNPDGSSLLRSPITLRWEGVPVEDALAALLNNHGLRMVPDPKTGIRRIAKKEAGAAPALAKPPPVIIETIPPSGAADVDPGLTEIRATFSKPMQDGSWSWSTWGEENYPAATGAPRYLEDRRTCVLPVTLKPHKVYAIWLNSETFQNFKDAQGQPAVPYLLIFQTRN